MKSRAFYGIAIGLVCAVFASVLLSPWPASGTQLAYVPSQGCKNIVNLNFGPFFGSGIVTTLDPRTDNQNPLSDNSNASCYIITDFQMSADVDFSSNCDPCAGFDVQYAAVSGGASRILLKQAITPGDPVASDHYTTGMVLRAGEVLELTIISDGGALDGVVISINGFQE